jgi:hypothetical protein
MLQHAVHVIGLLTLAGASVFSLAPRAPESSDDRPAAAGSLDLFVFHIDNPGGENHGYYRVGRHLDSDGNVPNWDAVQGVPDWFGSENQGGDIAIADLDADGRSELLVLHIDNPPGENHGYYRVGRRLDASGAATRGWSVPKPIPGWFGSEDQGAGLTVGDVSRNGRPDLVVFHIDNPQGENHGYYRIGFDLDTAGNARRWSEVKSIPGWFGSEDQGGGVALKDIDGNGRSELLVCHIDNPQGENHGYYRVGFDLRTSGNARRWSNVKSVPGWFGSENQGGGCAIRP